jgi:hypothetical protein
MKKLLIAAAIMLLAAGAFTQDMSLSAGVQANFFYQEGAYNDGPLDYVASYPALGIGAYVDLTYAMISLNYAFTVGDFTGTVYNDGEKDDGASEAFTDLMEGMAASYLVITALGRYPIDLGGVTLSPMLGLEYQLNLTLTRDGDDIKDDLSDEDKEKLNDLFVLGGVCADFNIMESIYIRVLALFAYNLTPDNPGNPPDPDAEWGWGVRGGIAVGYMF